MSADRPQATLKRQVARGAALLALSTAAKYVISLLKLIVLARILEPSAFGIMGLALVFVRGLELAGALGPEKHIIQRREITDELIGSTWSLKLLFAIGMSAFAVITSGLYSGWVNEPRAATVLSIAAIATALRGFRSRGFLLAERDLNYTPIAIHELTVALADFIATVILAVVLDGPEALALGMVFAALVDVVTSMLLFRGSARPAWHWDSIREILSVGRHYLVVALATFAMTQGDNVVVGGMLGATALGYYLVAYRLCDVPTQVATQITNRLVFAVFSRAETDGDGGARLFLSIFSMQAAVLVPSAVGVLVLADSLIGTLFGSEWAPAVACLRGLGLVMFAKGLTQVLVPFLIARGHLAYIARSRLVEVGVLLLGVVIGCACFGLLGAGPGAGVGFLCSAVSRLWYLSRHDRFPIGPLLRELFIALAACIPGGTMAVAVDLYLPAPAWIRLVVGAVSFAGPYVGMLSLLRPELLRRLFSVRTLLRPKAAEVPARMTADPTGPNSP